MSVSKNEFFRRVEKVREGREIRPKFSTLPSGTLYAKRAMNIAILEAATRRMRIWVLYRKATTDEEKGYLLEPYSYRYKWVRRGPQDYPGSTLQKVLYGYDRADSTIKMFVKNRILKVVITRYYFWPRWTVEILPSGSRLE